MRSPVLQLAGAIGGVSGMLMTLAGAYTHDASWAVAGAALFLGAILSDIRDSLDKP